MSIMHHDTMRLDFAEPWLLSSQPSSNSAYEPQYDTPAVRGRRA
ncbi:hypothetical protein [Bifidobacterium biavatii]|uniref:Uncharacterized protein n=1 Tax=Bifidobacterium biavatii DSM 23969 TaxID=1437608 RepID=A0A087A0B4_9BIFI|nr:hypothetical protein [Bifidobacterium biavatii]KFI52214.1 hypothetical protein BBIA_0509 [Bifidobacterium biavatii DSM 23969]